MLKYQTFQQLHAALINSRMTTLSHDHSGHDHSGHVTQVGGGSGGWILWPLIPFMASWLLWMAMGSFTFLLKSLSSLTSIFTSAKVYLWPLLEVCSVMAEWGCIPSVCSLDLTPSVPAVSPM